LILSFVSVPAEQLSNTSRREQFAQRFRHLAAAGVVRADKRYPFHIEIPFLSFLFVIHSRKSHFE
jgi:hypothetical protein